MIRTTYRSIGGGACWVSGPAYIGGSPQLCAPSTWSPDSGLRRRSCSSKEPSSSETVLIPLLLPENSWFLRRAQSHDASTLHRNRSSSFLSAGGARSARFGTLDVAFERRFLSTSAIPLHQAAQPENIPNSPSQQSSPSPVETQTDAGGAGILQQNTPSSGASPAPEEAAASALVEVDAKNVVLEFLPDKPVPLDSTKELAESLLLTGDPPLEALGLASWWPSGRLQHFMEYMHSNLDMPWWQAIILTTLCMRVLSFPLVVMSQKNAANLNNNMPQMQLLQNKMSDARRRGDVYDSSVAGMELSKFMKEKKLNPLKNIIPIGVQLPIFMSMFIGLRGMANLPLESMMTGGLAWFSDLTTPDPFYALPLLTSATLFLQFKFAADGANLQQVGPLGKFIMHAMPVALFPLTMNFPAAITFYWLVTNIISVAQARIIRFKPIRERLGIPKMIVWDKSSTSVKDKGLKESFKEALDNWKVQADIVDRRVYDEQMFREAGHKVPKVTYKFDPTKPISQRRT